MKAAWTGLVALAGAAGAPGTMAAPTTAAATGGFALHDGDRVVFYGDSITEQQFYATYVEDYVTTRYPGLRVRFSNAGWKSDTVAGGFGGPIDQRLRRDVVARKPSVVTVMLGMNDGHRLAWNAPMAAAYETGYAHLLDVLKLELPAARTTLLAPTPFDDTTKPPEYTGGYNAVLLKFGAFVGETAHRRGLPWVDMNTPLTQLLERAKGVDATLATKLIPDRIHPGPAAHWVMARTLLHGWGATPWVSQVVLGWHDGQPSAGEQVHTRVTGLARAGTGLAWTQLDAALPLAFEREDPFVALVLKASDVQQALSRQPLVVNGLPTGSWALAIDGQQIGRFTAAELATGIDLATLKTPMLAQAERVHALTVAHQAVAMARWRQVEVPLANWPSAPRTRTLADMTALEDDLIARQHAEARPKQHIFKLVALS